MKDGIISENEYLSKVATYFCCVLTTSLVQYMGEIDKEKVAFSFLKMFIWFLQDDYEKIKSPKFVTTQISKELKHYSYVVGNC